jgi:hypothetical protein
MFEYTYFDKVKQQNQTATIEAGVIDIPAEIKLTVDGVRLSTNEAGNEVLAGDSPARVIIDAKNVFTDYNIPDTQIIWDIDGDGVDETGAVNKAFFAQNFMEGKVYNVRYRFPSNTAYPLYYYSFPLRVLPSDTPTCSVSQEPGSNGSIIFKGNRDNGG